eukprot:2610995-Rhodomonas_salina.1
MRPNKQDQALRSTRSAHLDHALELEQHCHFRLRMLLGLRARVVELALDQRLVRGLQAGRKPVWAQRVDASLSGGAVVWMRGKGCQTGPRAEEGARGDGRGLPSCVYCPMYIRSSCLKPCGREREG